RRHCVGLRGRRRRDRLERCERNVQRDLGAGAPRLHGAADRKALGRQPAARDGRGPAHRARAAAGKRIKSRFRPYFLLPYFLFLFRTLREKEAMVNNQDDKMLREVESIKKLLLLLLVKLGA